MSVRHAILGLLAQHPRHGYELRAAFEALAGGSETWEVKPAQIYSTLERLEQSGFISECLDDPENPPDKRVFQLTEAGRALLNMWFETGVEVEHQRDEFFIKLMVALLSGEADPRRVIHVQRITLFKALHQVTAQRDQLDSRMELAQLMLMDKAIMHLEADIRWLDFIESRLDEVRNQPLPQPEIRGRGRPRKI